MPPWTWVARRATSMPMSVHHAFDTGVSRSASSPFTRRVSSSSRVSLQVDGLGVEIEQAAHRLDGGAHREQHAAHVGVLDDRAGLAGRCRGRPALAPFGRVGGRLLVRGLGHRQTGETDGEPGVVHHREHGAHTSVQVSHQVADGFVVLHDARGAGVDAELVLDRQAPRHGCAQHRVEQELRHDEAGDPPRARRGVGCPRQDEVDDVVDEVVLPVGDEDLRCR